MSVMKQLLAILVVSCSGDSIPWSCDKSYNFILDVSYAQISLTDGCDNDGVCNANPIYVPEYAANHSTDAATEFCKAKCEDAREFWSFANFLADVSGEEPLTSDCSQCTGFFFQRHTNGHEICGFYTIDLNDGNLNKIGHGHSEGSQLCIKNKLEIATEFVWENQTNETNESDDRRLDGTPIVLGSSESLELATEVTQRLGWKSCGAQFVNATQETNGSVRVQRVSFRYDLSEIPGGTISNTSLLIENVTQELFSARRLAQSGGCQGIHAVPSCMDYTCGDGLTEKSGPKAYCQGTECRASECCEGDGNDEPLHGCFMQIQASNADDGDDDGASALVDNSASYVDATSGIFIALSIFGLTIF